MIILIRYPDLQILILLLSCLTVHYVEANPLNVLSSLNKAFSLLIR